jgi:hypothetical protein
MPPSSRLRSSDHFQEQKNQDDEQNKAYAASAVVANSRPQTVSAEAKQQNQNDKKNDHDASELLKESDAISGLPVCVPLCLKRIAESEMVGNDQKK